MLEDSFKYIEKIVQRLLIEIKKTNCGNMNVVYHQEYYKEDEKL